MKFTCEIDMDNAAFDDCPATEAARILRNVARMVEEGRGNAKLLDTNGNTVGKFAVTKD